MANAMGTQKLVVSSKDGRDWSRPCRGGQKTPILGLLIRSSVLVSFISIFTFFGSSAPRCYPANPPTLSQYPFLCPSEPANLRAPSLEILMVKSWTIGRNNNNDKDRLRVYGTSQNTKLVSLHHHQGVVGKKLGHPLYR